MVDSSTYYWNQEVQQAMRNAVNTYFSSEDLRALELMGWQINQNLIPEPTTATLSLLALAGLAARRRRASR